MEIEQISALSVDGFISQIGGQLGIFLGASLLSVIQMLLFCLETCYDRIAKRSRGSDVSQAKSDEKDADDTCWHVHRNNFVHSPAFGLELK